MCAYGAAWLISIPVLLEVATGNSFTLVIRTSWKFNKKEGVLETAKATDLLTCLCKYLSFSKKKIHSIIEIPIINTQRTGLKVSISKNLFGSSNFVLSLLSPKCYFSVYLSYPSPPLLLSAYWLGQNIFCSARF